MFEIAMKLAQALAATWVAEYSDSVDPHDVVFPNPTTFHVYNSDFTDPTLPAGKKALVTIRLVDEKGEDCHVEVPV
jgi:hypothetical protein